MNRQYPRDIILDAFIAALFGPGPEDLARINSGQVDPTLRKPCGYSEPVHGTGYHKHTCQCGTSWKHDDLLPAICPTEAMFQEAHTCPSCGLDVREKDWTHG